MQRILKNKSYSVYAILVITLFCTTSSNFFVNWGDLHHPFKNDVNQYYSYLNAIFVEHDLTFKNNLHSYWLIETPIHKVVPKVTYGMAFFYCPFYLFAKLLSDTNSTGYESPYAWIIHFGCIIYILVGLWVTRKTLLLWFSDKIVAFVILLLFFGTNLFYYTVSESESVHGVLFFLISIFLYNVVKWHQTKHKINFLLLSFIAGFICLIRPTECLVLLFPLLIGVTSINDIRTKINALIQLKWNLLIGLVLFIIPIIPQLIYWKIQSGGYLFFSYGNSESFFWNDPQIINVLFSYRKGWLIYSPLMIFSLFGFILLFKKNREMFWAILIYFSINLYLISAWWDWAFGGSFGMRALVHMGPVLIIPLCYIIQSVVQMNKHKLIKIVCYMIFTFFCSLNVFQSNLYKHGIISYDGMTKEAYWFTFFKKTYSKEDLIYLETLVKHPNYSLMQQGQRAD